MDFESRYLRQRYLTLALAEGFQFLMDRPGWYRQPRRIAAEIIRGLTDTCPGRRFVQAHADLSTADQKEQQAAGENQSA